MIMTSLNKKHAHLIEKYIKFVQGIVYEATEDCEPDKFEEFNEILVNIVNYTNAFHKMVKTADRMSEWAYMIPNLMLYAAMGFLSGIKNKTNTKEIDSLCENLFEGTVDFVGETSDILSDIKTKDEIRQKIKKIQKERNEHNS